MSLCPPSGWSVCSGAWPPATLAASCCSQYGWLGYSPSHCARAPLPIEAPPFFMTIHTSMRVAFLFYSLIASDMPKPTSTKYPVNTVKEPYVLRRKTSSTGKKVKRWVLTPKAKRAMKSKRTPATKRARGGQYMGDMIADLRSRYPDMEYMPAPGRWQALVHLAGDNPYLAGLILAGAGAGGGLALRNVYRSRSRR
ncbi:hypothetical protein EMVG_00118 [Emiliania huxleyi virus PS401]|nr:hypothetical protein EMVG_00118 [Emiliania huxleyi virus PS401]